MNLSRYLQDLDLTSLTQLADACLTSNCTLALIDADGTIIWQFGNGPAGLDFAAVADTPWPAGEDSELASLPSAVGGALHFDRIRFHGGEPIAALALHVSEGATVGVNLPLWLHAVSSELSRQLSLIAELEDMVNDLADRYEELNLVFALDADLRDASKAHQSLYQLLSNCVDYRRADCAILLYPEIEFIRHYGTLSATSPPTQALVDDAREHLWPLFAAGEHAWVDNHAISRSGLAERRYKILAVPVHSGERGVVGVLAWVRDGDSPDFTNSGRNLLDAMAQRVELIVNGSFDPLTGLLNRSNFEHSLQACSAECLEQSGDLCVLHLDIDYLQILNDTHGVEAGDRLIRDAAGLIRMTVGERGLAAHFGGGKFFVLLKGPTPLFALELAQRLCEDFKRLACPAFTPTISIGLTHFVPGAEPENTLAIAKAACTQAKKKGRNRVQLFQPKEKDLLEYRHDMEWFSRIHRAISDHRLELFGQAINPVANATTVRHFEVLLRMRGEDGAIIPPGMFLPTAERYSLMTMIDHYVIENCVDLLRMHRDLVEQGGLRLSVNLSGQSLNDPEFQAFLLQVLDENRNFASTLCFEVTESLGLNDLKEGDDFLGRLQSLGCTCALDDFGTGVSSFSYLRNLRVDSVKIDGSFIKELAHDTVCQAIVRSIREVAALKGIMTVAEFVENDEILHKLAMIGVDYAQGYGIHKPEPLGPLLDALGTRAKDSGADTGVSALVKPVHSFSI